MDSLVEESVELVGAVMLLATVLAHLEATVERGGLATRRETSAASLEAPGDG